MTTMPLASSLGHLERELMDLLWADGPQTAREALTVLQARRKVAYTTVSTTLHRLYERGRVTRDACATRRGQPGWRYTPMLSRQELLCAAIAQLCDEL